MGHSRKSRKASRKKKERSGEAKKSHHAAARALKLAQALSAAGAARAAGNAAFRAGDFRAALKQYKLASDELAKGGGGAFKWREEKVKCCSNASECHLQLEEWSFAAVEAAKALRWDPLHAKSLLRRAKALIRMRDQTPKAREQSLCEAVDLLNAILRSTADKGALAAAEALRIEIEPEFKQALADDLMDAYKARLELGRALADVDMGIDRMSMPMGFSQDELDELACQGIKPWDDDAHICLAALGY